MFLLESTSRALPARHVARFLNFAAFLSGASMADEAQKKAPKNTLQRKDKTVPWAALWKVEVSSSF